MRIHPRTILRSIPFLILAFVIISFSLYNFRALFKGPSIEVESVRDGDSFFDPRIILEGKTRNIKKMSLNDRPLDITRSETFREKYVLLTGYNVIKFHGSDIFGREVEYTLALVLVQDYTLPSEATLRNETNSTSSKSEIIPPAEESDTFEALLPTNQNSDGQEI